MLIVAQNQRIQFHALSIRLSLAALLSTASLGILPSPSHAYEIVYCEQDVLCGINGVNLTLPSSGLSGVYNIGLVIGTLGDIFGVPPVLDVSTAADAGYLMDQAARSINAYLASNPGATISFAAQGQYGYYIPYGYDGSLNQTNVSESFSVVVDLPPSDTNPISPQFTTIPADVNVVWAKLLPVPGPLPLLGVGAAFGYSRKLRKRIKTNKTPEVLSAIG
jgi:hypothetical protein